MTTFPTKGKARRFIKTAAAAPGERFALVQCGRTAHAVLLPSVIAPVSGPAKIEAASPVLSSLFAALVEALGLPAAAMRLVHCGSVFHGSAFAASGVASVAGVGAGVGAAAAGAGVAAAGGAAAAAAAASAASAASATGDEAVAKSSSQKAAATLTLLFTSAYHDAEAVRQVLRELRPTLDKLEKEAEGAARKQKHRAVAIGGAAEALLRLRLLEANAKGVRDTLQAINGTRGADWRRGVRVGTLGDAEREVQRELCQRAVKLCELVRLFFVFFFFLLCRARSHHQRMAHCIPRAPRVQLESLSNRSEETR